VYRIKVSVSYKKVIWRKMCYMKEVYRIKVSVSYKKVIWRKMCYMKEVYRIKVSVSYEGSQLNVKAACVKK
jgi:hypothetical protein